MLSDGRNTSSTLGTQAPAQITGAQRCNVARCCDPACRHRVGKRARGFSRSGDAFPACRSAQALPCFPRPSAGQEALATRRRQAGIGRRWIRALAARRPQAIWIRALAARWPEAAPQGPLPRRSSCCGCSCNSTCGVDPCGRACCVGCTCRVWVGSSAALLRSSGRRRRGGWHAHYEQQRRRGRRRRRRRPRQHRRAIHAEGVREGRGGVPPASAPPFPAAAAARTAPPPIVCAARADPLQAPGRP